MTSYIDDLRGQPTAIRDTVAAIAGDAKLIDRLAALRGKHSVAMLTGMGSSHAALYPMHLSLLEGGTQNGWIDAGELLHYGASGIPAGALLVVVSQSGETIEITRLLDRLPSGVTIVGVTNHGESTLARRADVPIVLRGGREGIVATKTYVATIAALRLATAAILGGSIEHEVTNFQAAATALDSLLGDHVGLTKLVGDTLGAPPRDLFLIGRGPGFASAQCGSLILKEASRTPAEPLTGGHFRHGPLEMVSSETSAIVFSPAGRTIDLTRRLAAEIHGYGARVLLVGPRDAALPGADLPIIDTGRLDESIAPVVEIIAPELLAIACARGRGREPAVFERLGKVTRTE